MNVTQRNRSRTVTPHQQKQDEKILVVKKTNLFPHGIPQGFHQIDFSYYQMLIDNKGEFLWRAKMETDPNYKQIVPYLLFRFEDRYFLMQRTNVGREKRLHNKYTLGIGGHLREEDMKGTHIIDWASREFNEEVDYQGSFKITPLGLINDEHDDVGKVHTGFVFLLEGDSPAIQIRSELKDGKLLTLKECEFLYHEMEPWSKMVYDFLLSYNK